MAKTNDDIDEAVGADTQAESSDDKQPAITGDDLAEVDDLKQQPRSVRETVAEAATTIADKAAGGPAVAPAHWKDEDKKFFAGIKDRAYQDYLIKRDKEYQASSTKTGGELAELRKQHEPIAKLFEPYAETLKRSGQSVADVVGNYLKAEEALRTKPVEALVFLAQRYKVTPEQLTAAMKGEAVPAVGTDTTTDDEIDPSVKPLVDRLAKLEQAAKAQADRQAADQQAQLNTSVARFEGAKGKDGTPLYPHATKPEIRRLMGVLIGSGEVNIETEGGIEPALKRAYEKAIRADDATHQALLSKAVEDSAKKAADERNARAKNARAASGSLSGGSSGAAASPGMRQGSIRDKLNKAAQDAGFIQ